MAGARNMTELAALALPQGMPSSLLGTPAHIQAQPASNPILPLNNPYKVRVALGVCAFSPYARQSQEWADLCIDVLNTAAEGGQLSDFPKIILALRGQDPERPRGMLNASNLPSIVTDTILEHGKNADAVAICTPQQGPLCPSLQKPYTLADLTKVLETGRIIPLPDANPNAATVLGSRAAAVVGFVDGYTNPERHRLPGSDGQPMSLTKTVAQMRIKNPDSVVRGKLAACFRGDEGKKPDFCVSAGVRAGMYKRVGNQQALLP